MILSKQFCLFVEVRAFNQRVCGLAAGRLCTRKNTNKVCNTPSSSMAVIGSNKRTPLECYQPKALY